MNSDDVKKIFRYEDGILIRRTSGTHGYLRPDGYRYTRLNGRSYGEHRLVYLMFTGEWPEQVDHKNGNKSDNRIENLRAATNAQNSMNRKGKSKGCYFSTKRNKWVAQIGIAGTRKTLGYYASEDEAKAAYAIASKELYGEFGRFE